MNGSPPKTYPGPMACWLGWMRVQASDLTCELVEMLLSATVQNDICFTTAMKNPASLGGFINERCDELTGSPDLSQSEVNWTLNQRLLWS